MATKIWALLLISLHFSFALDAFGVGTHFTEFRHWHHLKEIGVQWIRIDLSWNEFEKNQGLKGYAQVDAAIQTADSLGLKILGIIGYTPQWASCASNIKSPPSLQNYQNWLGYVDSVMTRFGKSVDVWEVWNEPDQRNFFQVQPGCPQWDGSKSEDENRYNSYVWLSKNTNQHIRKKFGSKIILISSGFSLGGDYDETFLPKILESQTELWKEWAALNVHGYGYPSNSSLNKRLSIASQFLKKYPNKTVWYTEHGVTKFAKDGISVENAGAFLVRNFAKALSSGVSKMFWFRLKPGGDYANLLDRAGNPTEFLWIYKRLIQHWSQVKNVQPWSQSGLTGAVGILPNGQKAVITWSESGNVEMNLNGVVSARDIFGNPKDVQSISISTSPLFLILK